MSLKSNLTIANYHLPINSQLSFVKVAPTALPKTVNSKWKLGIILDLGVTK